jgi:hypothetical protein
MFTSIATLFLFSALVCFSFVLKSKFFSFISFLGWYWFLALSPLISASSTRRLTFGAFAHLAYLRIGFLILLLLRFNLATFIQTLTSISNRIKLKVGLFDHMLETCFYIEPYWFLRGFLWEGPILWGLFRWLLKRVLLIIWICIFVIRGVKVHLIKCRSLICTTSILICVGDEILKILCNTWMLSLFIISCDTSSSVVFLFW